MRGSLGRKPERATQAKVRARKRRKRTKKKKNAKNEKKEEKKNIARKVENPERAALAKVRAQKERLIPECTLPPNYVRLDSHLWDT